MNSNHEQRIDALESKVSWINTCSERAATDERIQWEQIATLKHAVREMALRLADLENAWNSLFIKREYWEERKP